MYNMNKKLNPGFPFYMSNVYSIYRVIFISHYSRMLFPTIRFHGSRLYRIAFRTYTLESKSPYSPVFSSTCPDRPSDVISPIFISSSP